jgi:hypothetical protein
MRPSQRLSSIGFVGTTTPCTTPLKRAPDIASAKVRKVPKPSGRRFLGRPRIRLAAYTRLRMAYLRTSLVGSEVISAPMQRVRRPLRWRTAGRARLLLAQKDRLYLIGTFRVWPVVNMIAYQALAESRAISGPRRVMHHVYGACLGFRGFHRCHGHGRAMVGLAG